MEEQRASVVHRVVVRREIAVILRHETCWLGVPIELDLQRRGFGLAVASPTLIAILGIQRHCEVMHPLRVPSYPLTPGRGAFAPFGGWRSCAVIIALIIDGAYRIAPVPGPPGIPTDRHPGGPDDLILWHVEIDDETAELPVKLAAGIKRMLFPPIPVIHDDLRIPLREIESPP